MFTLLIRKAALDKVKKEIQQIKDNIDNNILPDIIKNYNNELKKWEEDLKEKLSDPLDRRLWHLPRDPSRYFPHKNTGNLLKSIKSDTNVTRSQNVAYIHSWIEIGVPYASLLNQGLPLRRDGITPNWKGFTTDLFDTHEGRRGLKSVLDVFDDLVNQFKTRI